MMNRWRFLTPEIRTRLPPSLLFFFLCQIQEGNFFGCRKNPFSGMSGTIVHFIHFFRPEQEDLNGRRGQPKGPEGKNILLHWPRGKTGPGLVDSSPGTHFDGRTNRTISRTEMLWNRLCPRPGGRDRKRGCQKWTRRSPPHIFLHKEKDPSPVRSSFHIKYSFCRSKSGGGPLTRKKSYHHPFSLLQVKGRRGKREKKTFFLLRRLAFIKEWGGGPLRNVWRRKLYSSNDSPPWSDPHVY